MLTSGRLDNEANTKRFSTVYVHSFSTGFSIGLLKLCIVFAAATTGKLKTCVFCFRFTHLLCVDHETDRMTTLFQNNLSIPSDK